MITIRIKPARQWFGRKQWKFEIVAANGGRIDPRDTYANIGDIRTALSALTGAEPITLEIHYSNGIQREQLR